MPYLRFTLPADVALYSLAKRAERAFVKHYVVECDACFDFNEAFDEIVRNALFHGSKFITVRVSLSPAVLSFCVTDDGDGFDMDSELFAERLMALTRESHWGLLMSSALCKHLSMKREGSLTHVRGVVPLAY
jgi:anti-sigma regulatory factor (Ser/Thr protein kinase)